MEEVKLTVEQRERSLSNLKKEREAYPVKLKHNEEILGFLDRRIDIHKRMLPIIQDGLKPLKPSREYEQNDAYWELQKDLTILEHDSNMKKMVGERDTLVTNIENIKAEIKRIDAEIPRLEKELEGLKGE